LIYIFLALVAIIVVAIVASDILGSRPDKRGENPFAYEVDEYLEVDPSLVLYEETKNMKLQSYEYRGIDISGDSIFIVADNFLQVIDLSGRELANFDLPESPRNVKVMGDSVFVVYQKSVSCYDRAGELISTFTPVGDSTVLTSLAVVDAYVYAADAGNRKVHRFSRDGELLGNFGGKREADDLHGFIIPSPYFDIVNNYDDLWVVNTGMHTFENYSAEGDLRGYWENTSMSIEGFSGCCNPAHVAVLPNGNFVTSEKGLVRVKVYELSGKFKGVVAGPQKFNKEGHAPDVAVAGDGDIYALDFDRKMIRVFVEKEL